MTDPTPSGSTHALKWKSAEYMRLKRAATVSLSSRHGAAFRRLVVQLFETDPELCATLRKVNDVSDDRYRLIRLRAWARAHAEPSSLEGIALARARNRARQMISVQHLLEDEMGRPSLRDLFEEALRGNHSQRVALKARLMERRDIGIQHPSDITDIVEAVFRALDAENDALGERETPITIEGDASRPAILPEPPTPTTCAEETLKDEDWMAPDDEDEEDDPAEEKEEEDVDDSP
jgi:hypothetical protein